MTTVASPGQLPVKPLAIALEFQADEVVFRFHHDTQVPLDDAHYLFIETKRWLWACSKRAYDERAGKIVPAQLVISPEIRAIDQMWHCFLLFTREYHLFCQTYLGEFVHHTPLIREQLDAFNLLRAQNSKKALEQRQNELRPQLEYLYDLFGPQVLIDWYRDLPKRFQRFSKC